MKSREGVRNVETDGLGEEKGFSISASSKAFQILSSQIYSDSKLAIVRELACNAQDAHVEAGKANIPFEIHLPNIMSPQFKVKDYGTGLSPEDVTNLYTSYFESTKNDSNDYTGMLGLGSKTPFSYSDQFTVTSRYNGKIYYYTAFIAKEGFPNITLLGEDDTDEPNGLEIAVPVDQADYRIFADKVRHALKHFDPLPEVYGVGDQFGIDAPQYDLTGNGWGIRESKRGFHMNAIQGNVEYSIKLSQVEEVLKQKPQTRSMFHSNVTIDLFFDIGEVDIAASRESLHYDEETKNNIATKIENLAEELHKNAQDIIEQCDTFWDAKELYASKDLTLSMVSRAFGRNLVYYLNGVRYVINSSFVAVNSLHYDDLKIVGYRPPSHMGKYAQKLSPVDNVDAGDDIQIFHNDLKTGGYSRVSYHVRMNGKKNTLAILIDGDDPFDWAMLKKWVFTNNKIRKTSELDAPPKNQKKSSPTNMGYNIENVNDSSWPYENFENVKSGYYVEVYNLNICDQYTNYNGPKARNIIQDLIRSGYKIYGVKRTYLNKFKNDSNWVDAFELADSLAKSVKNTEMANKMAIYSEMNNINNQILNSLFDVIRSEGIDNMTYKGSFLYKVWEDLKYIDDIKTEYRENQNNLYMYYRLAYAVYGDGFINELGGKKKNLNFDTIEDMYDKLVEKYPMLTLVDEMKMRRYQNAQEIIRDYIFDK